MMKFQIKRKLPTVLILCTLLLAMGLPIVTSQIESPPTPVFGDNQNWWNTNWQYRKLLTIDHTLITADLTNFPVLVARSTDPDLTKAQPTGQDIVFIRYQDNTTVYAHEIECYNHQTGQLIAWVKLSSVSASMDTRFWMYYGNPSCGPQGNIPGTWDSGYVMVQHLNETSGILSDSTSYQNDGITIGTNPVNAKIDGGHQWDDNDRIIIHNFTHTPTALTVEAWVYRDTTQFIYIADKGIYSNTDTDWILYLRNNHSGNEGIDFSVQNHASFIRKGDTPVGSWFYVTATYNGGSAALYYNGNVIGTGNGWPAIPNNYPHLGLGNDYNGTEGGYYPMTDVRIDEVRVSNIARSSCWIAACYANQNNPASFISFGSEQQHQQTIYTLTLTSNPPQGGSINAVPSPPYYPNDLVTLTAIPNQGYVFDQWSGDLTGTQNPDTILMNGNKSVTATFIAGNTPPVAVDDAATVVENSSDNQIDVLANDYDPDGDALTIIEVKPPQHGTASHDGAYAYYTPTPAYTGSDNFTYTISDGHGGTASATVTVTVIPAGNNPPYTPAHPVPNDGETNVSVTTDLWWTGGDPDPSDHAVYDVYFGTNLIPPQVSANQTNSTYDPGVLAKNTTYFWRIISWDTHGACTPGPLWRFTTESDGPGNITVSITRPREHSFYLRNFRLMKLPRNTIVYGPITITADVTADGTVDRVEFYIDGKLKKSDDSAPYSYRWSQLRCFKHEIIVKAYDTNDNSATDTLIVFKWRLHPLLIIGGYLLLTSNYKTPSLFSFFCR